MRKQNQFRSIRTETGMVFSFDTRGTRSRGKINFKKIKNEPFLTIKRGQVLLKCTHIDHTKFRF